ncbi:MAG: ribonuclease catalytic domain-containing protein, partial [PS1 clade bacterium]
CTENIKNNTFQEGDIEHIESIERVALNRSRHAKILSALEIDNTPEEAHRLLLKLGYYKQSFNPYPQRNKIPKDLLLDVKCNKVDRVDLTHLESYAIDNKGSADADDAISIEGDKLWVHIADVSSVVEDNSEMDLYAQERASNLYLPDQIIHMLPTSVTSTCALGLKETSDALSIGFCIKDEEVEDITIIRSTIRVKKISYDVADSIIDSDNNLSIINNIAMMHKEYRKKNGAIKLDLPNVDVRLHDENVSITPQKSSPSRELVAEMMVLAGRVVAIYAAENEIPMPYSVQGDGDFPKEILDNSGSLTLSESFGATKYFKRSSFSVNIKPHSGLGLSAYIRVTSPLRRYLDLLVHQQLSRFISNRDIISEKQIKEVIKKINSTLPNVNKAIRSSNEHYKCLYLLQNKNWQGEGVVVDTRGEKALVLVPSIGMIGQVKTKSPVSLDDSITVKATSVDLCSLSVNFNKA